VKVHLAVVLRASALVTLLAAVGCSKTMKEVHFQPLAKPEVGTQDLAPIAARPVTELLREADTAFQQANASQERGDYEAALRHYQKMLEYLIEADLDPAVFYNLRGEFERILRSGTDHARLFDERGRIKKWSAEDFAGVPVKGDLEIPFPLPARVLEEIDEIQTVYPKNFQRGLDRAFLYMPYIQQEFAKAGLPQDLVWLAMVESQFYPTAVSPAGATGMWQFMGATGRRYGLRVDNYVDDRKNWEKSTQAAVAYLKDLRDQFNGNWPLAVASYNMGEYGMERAINVGGGETDLWKLIEHTSAKDKFQEETKKFYPKLLASILVAKSPEKYGFQANRQQPIDTVRIPVQGGYKLAALEKAGGLANGCLAELNPDLLRGFIPSGGVHMLAVPNTEGEKVLAALNTLKPESNVVLAKASDGTSKGQGKTSFKRKTTTHTVKRGETLGKIASAYGVTVREIMDANRLRSDKRVTAGQRLTIPTFDSGSQSVVAKAEPKEVEKTESATVVAKIESGDGVAPVQASSKRTDIPDTYTVKRGDTLFDIATRFHVDVKDLQAWNKMGKGSGLHIGDTITLTRPADFVVAEDNTKESAPAETKSQEPEVVTAAAAPQETKHIVQSGEFPAKIAAAYGVGVAELLEWNGLTSKSTLHTGDTLVVRAAKKSSIKETAPQESPEVSSESAGEIVTAKADASSNRMTHTVAKGETLSTIAAKYKVKTADLAAWNGLNKTSVIKVGASLSIQKSPATAPEPVKIAKATPGKASVDGAVTGDVDANDATQKPRRIEHTVAKDEFPGAIAQQYGVTLSNLKKWNNWSATPLLQIGSKVVVFVQ
jgi:membrane-bound lytic murein transglycosylase D